MESDREKHIKWSWHPYHMVCVAFLWSSLQLSPLSKVLPSPTPGANKRKAEDSKGKGSAKKPSAGAAKKGVFKRWNIHLTELKKKTFPIFPCAVFLIDEMTPEIPVTVFCSFTHAAVLTDLYWTKYLSEVSHWEMEEPSENAVVTPSSPLPRKASRRST